MFFKKNKRVSVDSGLNENGSVLLAKSLIYSGTYKLDIEVIADALGERFKQRSLEEQITCVAEVRLCLLSTFMILLRVPRYGIGCADIVEKALFEELSEVHIISPGDLTRLSKAGQTLPVSAEVYTDRLECRKLMSNRYWEYSEILKNPFVHQDAGVMGLAIQQACRECGEHIFDGLPGMDFVVYLAGLLAERVVLFEKCLGNAISMQKQSDS